MEIVINTDAEVLEKRLLLFGRDAPEMLDRVLAFTGRDYASFTRKGYLSGQMLGRRSGKTYRTFAPKKSRRATHQYYVFSAIANIFEHAGGVDIYPRGAGRTSSGVDSRGRHSARWAGHVLRGANVLFWRDVSGAPHTARHVHLAQRPFITASVGAFSWAGSFDRGTEEVFGKELKKRGLADEG